MKRSIPFCILLSLLLSACAPSQSQPAAALLAEEYRDWTIVIRGDGIEGEQAYSLGELAALEGGSYAAVYSVINNWPTCTTYAGEGVTVAAVLREVGVYDRAQTVTVGSEDGYRASFTRAQLLGEQFYYPNCGENGEGALPVEPIIAYAWKQGGDSLEQIRSDAPCLILGQSDCFQHNNPVFVEGVTYIEVSDEAEQWAAPYIWPEQDVYRAGDKIKLQHEAYSNVKIYYTTDGSQPTVYSPMYNPSTYQPELNLPLEVSGSMTVRAFAVGYGKADSETVQFLIKAED